MKAICVFLIGVAVGWMLLPRLEPEIVVELEPIVPEPGPGLAAPWMIIARDGSITWTRTN